MRPVLIDACERVGWTFVQAFAAALLAAGVFDSGALTIGATAAVIAALKAIVATKVGDRESAATLPAGAGTPAAGRRRAVD